MTCSLILSSICCLKLTAKELCVGRERPETMSHLSVYNVSVPCPGAAESTWRPRHRTFGLQLLHTISIGQAAPNDISYLTARCSQAVLTETKSSFSISFPDFAATSDLNVKSVEVSLLKLHTRQCQSLL